MKKVFSLLLVAGFAAMTIVSCGPSAEEKAAAEKAVQDSIAAATAQATADSIAAASAAAEQAAKATADSLAAIATQDSIAAAEKKAANKPKPKTPVQKKVEETKKVTSGRG